MTQLDIAFQVIKTIQEAGYEAYICGGTVRDHLLHIGYQDIDIATSAKPSQVMKMFESKPTGIRYGTITVFLHDHQFEVTTFRTDGPSEDQRHPDYVYYGVSAEEDVLRRDFTINGLLMTINGDILDYVQGQADIELRKIRAIGDPLLRFAEDGLRMLRALYFQAKLNFGIEAETLKAMKLQGMVLKTLAKERVLNEMLKIIKSPYAKRAFQTMQQIGYDDIIPGIKEAVAYHIKHDVEFSIDVFFGMCTYFSKEDMLYFPFPNKQRHKYEKASLRAKEAKALTKQDVYQDGIEIMKLTGWLLYHLHQLPFKSSDVESLFQTLGVKSVLDLKMTSKEMMALAHKPAGAWIKEVQAQMIEAINLSQLENTREALFTYFRTHYLKVGEKS